MILMPSKAIGKIQRSRIMLILSLIPPNIYEIPTYSSNTYEIPTVCRPVPDDGHISMT